MVLENLDNRDYAVIVVMVLADLNECLHIILGKCSLHIEVIVRVENCSLHLHQWTCVVGESVCVCVCVCMCVCVCVCVWEGGGGPEGEYAWT